MGSKWVGKSIFFLKKACRTNTKEQQNTVGDDIMVPPLKPFDPGRIRDYLDVPEHPGQGNNFV